MTKTTEFLLETPSSHVNTDELKVPRERPKRQYEEGVSLMKFPPIPGFRTYVANYIGDEYDFEMMKLRDKGYEPVLRKEIDPEAYRLGESHANARVIFSVGQGMRGILLKIPQEWWDEDYKKFTQENAESMHGVVTKLNKDITRVDPNIKGSNSELTVTTKFISI